MNDLFRLYLRKFVLVFFDDVLIYSDSMETQIQHLQTVLKVLKKEKLYAKQSKWMFGESQVEYLGHIISKEWAATNPPKDSGSPKLACAQVSQAAAWIPWTYGLPSWLY